MARLPNETRDLRPWPRLERVNSNNLSRGQIGEFANGIRLSRHAP
jgi:hypothetical protein